MRNGAASRRVVTSKTAHRTAAASLMIGNAMPKGPTTFSQLHFPIVFWFRQVPLFTGSIPISLTSSWEVKPCLRLQGSISVITETVSIPIPLIFQTPFKIFQQSSLLIENCFQESTPISDIVPHGSKNVHVCGNCDPSNPYLMLRWSNDKFLVLFFVVEESLIKTFRLDQVQYVEGNPFHNHPETP